MNQKLERQVLQRTYTYDNGDYVMVLDLGRSGLDADLGFDRGHLHVSVFHPQRGMIGEFSVPIRERLEGEPELNHNNGVITLESKLDTETKPNNFDEEDSTEELDEIEEAEEDYQEIEETEEASTEEDDEEVESLEEVEDEELDDSSEETDDTSSE